MREVILLRWVLIIATAYLVLFSRTTAEAAPAALLFVAAYFASNVVLPWVLRLSPSQQTATAGVVLFDTFAASLGLLLAGNVSHDFFLLFFLVLFLGALTNRLGLVVGAAILSCTVHLGTVLPYLEPGELYRSGYLLRIPFLFAVAVFFGHLVENEKRQREEVRADLMAMVSHDLKSPLSLIQSMAELLLDGAAGSLDEEQTDLVRRIHSNARAGIRLSRNVLDAARIEEESLMFHLRAEDLADVVAQTIPLAETAAVNKGVTLEYSPGTGASAVHIDSAQIEHVVTNLLDNAIKYTPAGGTVNVAIRRRAGEVALTVCDDGPGIPREEIPSLFEKYRRSPETGRIEGWGLGLFIVKSIVQAHGGTVDVESSLGRGTAMTIRLPELASGNDHRGPEYRPRARGGWPRWLPARASRGWGGQ